MPQNLRLDSLSREYCLAVYECELQGESHCPSLITLSQSSRLSISFEHRYLYISVPDFIERSNFAYQLSSCSTTLHERNILFVAPIFSRQPVSLSSLKILVILRLGSEKFSLLFPIIVKMDCFPPIPGLKYRRFSFIFLC